MRKLLAIVYGCRSTNERFDPTYEKRLKARETERKSAADSSSEEKAGQNSDLPVPVSRKEAKKRRKATSPEQRGSPSARGQGAFLNEYHNGESASEQAWYSTGHLDRVVDVDAPLRIGRAAGLFDKKKEPETASDTSTGQSAIDMRWFANPC